MMLEAWCDDVCGLRRHLDGNQQVGLDFVEHPGEVARIDEASEGLMVANRNVCTCGIQ